MFIPLDYHRFPYDNTLKINIALGIFTSFQKCGDDIRFNYNYLKILKILLKYFFSVQLS